MKTQIDISEMRMLIVSPSAVARLMLSRILEGLQCLTDQAATPKEARSWLDQAATEKREFAVVLIDSPSPEADLLEILGPEEESADLPRPSFVVLTSAVEEWTTDSLRKAGFAAALAKPCSERQMLHCLQSAVATSESEAQASQIRVLIADDSHVNRLVATRTLLRLGYTVESVCNGLEAVEYHRDNDYDVILMDCEMPEMDGFEATRRIRSGAVHPDIPIIALTGSDSDHGREACIRAGMNAHIKKPVEAEVIRAAIEDWVGRESHNSQSLQQKSL
ncbi:MAG: response regulator [Thermoanaerobaculales bacterium]|nr:response regulator [Thermoanaerobaculales bacterium]